MTESSPKLIFDQQEMNERIRIWQQGERRWLDFDDGLIQSEINLDKPELLPQVLNRAMLAGILFEALPKRILLVGTGGGATARYFSHRFPHIKGDAVDISESVLSLARRYFEFPENEQWQIIHDDIKHYVEVCTERYDLIIIDIAVEQKTPEWVFEQQFLNQCKALLTEHGQVSFNLLVEGANEFMHYLSAVRRTFKQRTVCLSLPNYRNTVVLAFNSAPSFMSPLNERIVSLEYGWGIEFTEFYQQMLIDNPANSGVF